MSIAPRSQDARAIMQVKYDAIPADSKRPKLLIIFGTGKSKLEQYITKELMWVEKIAIATKFFDVSSITEDQGKAPKPRIVLVSKKRKIVFKGRVSSSRLYAAMRRAVRAEYKTSLDKFVKGIRKLMGRLDAIQVMAAQRSQYATKAIKVGGKYVKKVKDLTRKIDLAKFVISKDLRKLLLITIRPKVK